MTREQAFSRPVFCSNEVKELVKEIFDDIDNETCINCLYYDSRDGYCSKLNVYGMKFCDKFKQDIT